MLLEILMQCSCIILHQLPPLERRFGDIQIVIITNCVDVSSVGIKRVDCTMVRLGFRTVQDTVISFFILSVFSKDSN